MKMKVVVTCLGYFMLRVKKCLWVEVSDNGLKRLATMRTTLAITG